MTLVMVVCQHPRCKAQPVHVCVCSTTARGLKASPYAQNALAGGPSLRQSTLNRKVPGACWQNTHNERIACIAADQHGAADTEALHKHLHAQDAGAADGSMPAHSTGTIQSVLPWTCTELQAAHTHTTRRTSMRSWTAQKSGRGAQSQPRSTRPYAHLHRPVQAHAALLQGDDDLL